MANAGRSLHTANGLIEAEIRSRAADVERILRANVITYSGPIDDAGQGLLKVAVE